MIQDFALRPFASSAVKENDTLYNAHPMPRTLQLALLQHACPVDASPADNLATCTRLIQQAAADGAQLVVTQELFAAHYFPQVEDDALCDLAEPIPGPTSQALSALADELGITLSASLFEKRTAGVYHNTTVTFGSDGACIGKYRKMHIPDDPRFYEKYYFTPGDLGFETAFTEKASLGVLVCWDQWFPEAARATALHGAEVLIYPTAIGTWTGEMELKDTQHDAWRTMQRAHAIANGCFVAAVNRIGQEDDLVFWGRSFVAAPDGSILAEAGEGEEVLVVECDRAKIDAARQGWPFFRDRRIDAYDDLAERWIDHP